MSAENGELKPCPCCSSKDVGLSWIDNDHPFALVSCDGCGLCMERGGGHWQRAYLEADAITAWNTRGSTPEPTRLREVERLREALTRIANVNEGGPTVRNLAMKNIARAALSPASKGGEQ